MKENVIGNPPDSFRRIFRNDLPDGVLVDQMQEKRHGEQVDLFRHSRFCRLGEHFVQPGEQTADFRRDVNAPDARRVEQSGFPHRVLELRRILQVDRFAFSFDFIGMNGVRQFQNNVRIRRPVELAVYFIDGTGCIGKETDAEFQLVRERAPFLLVVRNEETDSLNGKYHFRLPRNLSDIHDKCSHLRSPSCYGYG